MANPLVKQQVDLNDLQITITLVDIGLVPICPSRLVVSNCRSSIPSFAQGVRDIPLHPQLYTSPTFSEPCTWSSTHWRNS
jgi:hypothetical protein